MQYELLADKQVVQEVEQYSQTLLLPTVVLIIPPGQVLKQLDPSKYCPVIQDKQTEAEEQVAQGLTHIVH